MPRALRIAGWTLGSVLLLIVLVIIAVLVIGNTDSGRRLIERQTAALTDGHVQLSGLSGPFPSAIDLAQLKLSDERGVWLTAERASLRWTPLSLLAWHINVDLVKVEKLDVERRPITKPSPKKTSSTSIPKTDVHQVKIGTLTLGQELAGVRASLSVQGSAHLISMQDAKANLIARRTDGNGDYELALSFDPARMNASLKLEEDAGGTLANLLKYPDLGALSVTASLNGPRDAEVVQLTARAGELDARVRGTVDITRQSGDLTYSIEAPRMAPRPGLEWQHVSLHGQWHGTIKAPRADGRLQIAGLQIPGGAELAALNADLNADGGAVALSATAEGLVIPGPQPKLFSDSPLRLNARMQLDDRQHPLRLTADHRLFALQAHAITSGTQTAKFTLGLPDLAPLAALGGQTLNGKAEIKGKVEQSSKTTRLDLDANTELAPDPKNLLVQLLEGTSRLQLAAALTESAVDIERLSLNGRALSVSASGSAERGAAGAGSAVQSLRARYNVNLSDLNLISPTLAGTLKVNGQIDGPIKSMGAQLQATSNLSIRGMPTETLEASIKARGLPALTSATLQAQGRLAGAPLQLNAAVDRSGARNFHVVVHRTEWKSARIDGDLTTAADMTSGQGSLQLRMERLADLQPLLGTELGGSVAANVTLKPVNGQTFVDLRVDAQNVAASNLSANAHLSASGPTDALALQLAVQSPDIGGQPASLDTGARLNLTGRDLHLQRADVRYHGQSVRLLSPARLSFAQGLSVSQLRLGAQKATVTVDGEISPALDLRASVRQINSDLVEAFVPGVLAEGTIDGDARVQGSSSAPTGTITVKASNLRLASTVARDLAAVNIQANARLMGDTAQLDTQINTGRGSGLNLKGGVPLNANGELNLKLTGKLDAGLVNPILEARGERAGGTLNVNASVTGTAHAPQLAGTIDLTQGDLRDYAQGLHLSDITAHLVANEGVLQIAKLTARAAPGQITMTGTVGVLQPQIPIDIQLKADNAQPITSDILTASLNADLKVNGTLSQRIDLTGAINLRRAVIGIPGSMPPDVAVLDVRRPGEAPPPPPEHKLVIGLDLKMHAPREILVQGRGLDAELGGDLHITGTTDAPQVNGGFEMIRGSFKLVSTTLNFKEGRVSFNGAGLKHKIDPTLDFTAETTVLDAKTTMRITGLADAPQFELTSEPPLPQDEILARMLFGESASQLTALQLAQIGAALATLSGGGGGGGLNPVAKVQKALGLDRLSIGSGSSTGSTTGQGSGGTTVEAGRYVSNRVYVGARESTTGFSQVEVNVDLSKRLKLLARLGNGTANTQGVTPETDPGSSIGITYQYEY